MQKSFKIFGLRRSGNHAIIEWIAKHFECTIHYNDCIGYPNPTFIWSKHKYGNTKVKPVCEIFSYEDFEPSIEELQNKDTLFILRDWPNIAASRLKSKRGIDSARQRHNKERNRDAIDVWKEYIKLYEMYPEKCLIYNKLIYDKDYLKQIESLLHLKKHIPWTFAPPKSKEGQGSSFGRIDNNVNTRFLEIKQENPNLYKKIVKSMDLDISQHCKNIFNIVL